MIDVQDLKKSAWTAIDSRSDWLIDVAKTVLQNPEPGFFEIKTSKFVSRKLEELGIGRPSTYASIISVISTRGYAETINKKFHPTDRGKLISAFLEKLFSKYVDYNFTANSTFVSGGLNKLRHINMMGNPTTFITGIGLYNSAGQLLAIASLSKPLIKNFASEATIKVKLTY